jgi:hypothetical protein
MSLGPLAETLAQLTALNPYLGGRLGDDWPETWTTDDADGHLDQIFERIGTAWNTTDRRVQAASFVIDRTWRLVGPAIGSFLLARRVPALKPGTVVIRQNTDGSFDAPVFRTGSYAGLTGDQDASPAITEDGVLRLLRRRIEEHPASTDRNRSAGRTAGCACAVGDGR